MRHPQPLRELPDGAAPVLRHVGQRLELGQRDIEIVQLPQELHVHRLEDDVAEEAGQLLRETGTLFPHPVSPRYVTRLHNLITGVGASQP